MKVFQKIKELITDNYKKSLNSNVGKLHHIISRELNLLTMTFNRIEEWRDLDKAPGSTLDLIGRNFLEPRNNMSDEDYRTFIITKIAANRSPGDIETINKVCQTLFKDDFIRAEELWDNELYNNEPAGFRIVLNEGTKAAIPSRQVSRVAAGGVRVAWELALEPEKINIETELVTSYGVMSCRCGAFRANSCFGGSKFRRGRL